MNERIKQLADEAGIAVWGDAVYMYDPKDTMDSTVMAKFAKLIVEECIKLNGKELAMPGHSRMVEVYCEHFGIEY